MQGPAVTHLSVRVPWHDRRWDGHICSAPSNNNSCLVLKAISENRKDDAEDCLHDQDIDNLDSRAIWAPLGLEVISEKRDGEERRYRLR